MVRDDGKFFREIESQLLGRRRSASRSATRTGVSVQVLSTVPVMFSYWARGPDTLDLSRFLNDHIAGLVDRYPTRFIGLGTVPMQEPDLAIQELERCVKSLKLPGIEIGSHVNGRNLG